MKQALVLLLAVAATAAITCLTVVNLQQDEQSRRQARALAEADERIAQLEADLNLATERLRKLSEAQANPVDLVTGVSSRVQTKIIDVAPVTPAASAPA